MANSLGLSISTVSRALSGDPRVSSQTKQQVEQAARELRYRPSVLARGLKTKRTMTIGLIVIDVTYPMYASIARVVEGEASTSGYNVIICNSEAKIEKERRYFSGLLDRGVDGVLLTPVGGESAKGFHSESQDVPLVLVDPGVAEVPGSCASIDHTLGGYLATRYLISLGHERIALLNSSANFPWSKLLFSGYCEALEEAGITFLESMVIESDLDLTSGYQAASVLLGQIERPTAIFAASDFIAYGTLRAIKERNLRVPRDISLVGYGDIPIGSLLSPPLTTISYDVHQLGKSAARMLFKVLESTEIVTSERLILKPTLVLRKSAAMPRAKDA